jgi:uncharacterized phiE125 gp8 family phage protein
MNFNIVEQPTTYPISLEEARTHCRVTPYGSPEEHPDDGYISSLIVVATQFCEDYLRRSLSVKTIKVYFDAFAQKMPLPFLPVQSVESIEYLDLDGDTITLADGIYRLKSYNDEAKLNLIMNQSYPSDVAQEEGAVAVTIVTGYTTGLSPDINPMPEPIKAAMLLIIGHLYENRQEDVLGNTRISFNSLPMGVKNLVQPYRLELGL